MERASDLKEELKRKNTLLCYSARGRASERSPAPLAPSANAGTTYVEGHEPT
jgi:hypothetical protein